jgi:radical SAM protein with 4Fe4S-binding SPASM domain
MNYFLTKDSVLKWIETPSVYNITKDDLYELDNNSFEFLKNCSSETGGNSNDTEFIEYCVNEGILTKDRISMKRPSLKKSPTPSLRYLELQITDRCNLRCRHCYIGERGTRELSLNQIKNILYEFDEMQGLRVLLTGGEPLFHSSFVEINKILPEFFFRKVLFTNGLLLSKEILRNLNVHEIQVSIDGLEDAHDFLRGKGTFRLSMEAIKSSVETGFEVSVSTMVHAKNLEDFDEMEKLFKGLGIKDWTVDVPCITGRLQKNTDLQILPGQSGKYLGYGYGDGLHTGASGYACGLHLMSVMSDGRIAKCTFYADQAVGRAEEGLRQCWQRINPLRLSELNCDCEYIESCRGGCRYRAELLGDPLGKDLYRCSFYDIIKKE